MTDSLSRRHPIVSFLYFALVLLFSMIFMHPVCLLVSLLGALSYTVRLNGPRALPPVLKYLLPLTLLTAVLNPLFNHAGVTILFYLKNGNPVTLESILYGAAAACMLAAVLLWFSCCTKVLTSDKFVYLFGRAAPSLSLLLSMALRLTPRFIARFRDVSGARRRLGGGPARGLAARARRSAAIVSAVVTWALESSVETSDSMKARGYGLKGRTAFSLYRFTARDLAAAVAVGCAGVYTAAGAAFGALGFGYFPRVAQTGFTLYGASVFAAYVILCAAPVAINLLEDRAWKLFRSGI